MYQPPHDERNTRITPCPRYPPQLAEQHPDCRDTQDRPPPTNTTHPDTQTAPPCRANAPIHAHAQHQVHTTHHHQHLSPEEQPVSTPWPFFHASTYLLRPAPGQRARQPPPSVPP